MPSFERESVEFMASVGGKNCIKFDGDGAGTLILSIPASEMASLVLMLTNREKLLKVTIEPQSEKA